MREIPKQIFWWVLALAVALFLYGREQRHAGRDMEREQVLRSQIATTTAHADSVVSQYGRERHRADSLARLIPTFVARRGRAVAATDSVVARVDSILPTIPDTLRPVVAGLLLSIRTERLASDSLVASLESTVASLQRAVVSADSALLAKDVVMRSQAAMIVVLQRQAHPPLLERLFSAGRWAVLGAASALVWVAVR